MKNLSVILCMGLITTIIGCRTSTPTLPPNIPSKVVTGDYNDIKWLAETVATDLLEQRFFKYQTRPPLVAFLGIQNYSTLSGAAGVKNLVLRILTNSGKVRFVNDDQVNVIMQEMGSKQTAYSADARLAAGRQLGARYLIYGWMVDIPRTAREDARCQLTLELTDARSGLVIWSMPRERRVLLLTGSK